MKKIAMLAVALAPLALAGAADAQTRTASGVRDGLAWEAYSRIIAATPTSDGTTGVGGGDPAFFAAGNKSGTVALIMTYKDGSRFICSGSMVSSRKIVTAAHCVSNGAVKDADLVSTTAYFYTGDPNERTPFSPNAVAIEVSNYHVNPNYTGEVIDQNDIAVLSLSSDAPAFAQQYGLYYGDGLTGTQFNVAGYGGRSTIGGAFGNNSQTGWLREGDNLYDYAWGNSEFGGFFTDIINGENFFGTADIEYSYISDFDNGFAANDAACLIAGAVGASAGFGCSTGLGAREVNIAGGDSGGPGFVDGKLASVNSYGLSFGTAFGDYRTGLNSSWGEFSGYVPIYIHKEWLGGVVPEPATWAMMIAGFGLVGGALRRRRSVALSA